MGKLAWKWLLVGSATLALAVAGVTLTIAQEGDRTHPPLSELEEIPLEHPDFQALRSFGQRYSCPVSYEDGTPVGDRALTLEEFAAAVHICVDRVNSDGTLASLPDSDRSLLSRLTNEFASLVDQESNVTADTIDAEAQQPPMEFNPPPQSAPPHETITGGATLGGSSYSSDYPSVNAPLRLNSRVVPGSDSNVSPPSQPLILSEEEAGEFNREDYNPIEEHPFLRVTNNPLSTFGIDVDAASYSNVRRFLNNGQLPPKDAVRIEELINYFTYDYPEPDDDRPFSITTEISEAPWNRRHKLVQIGLQGKSIANEDLPPSNLVFLLDVSGSMNSPDKLPLLKSAFRLLVNELDEDDRVSIVVYAGAAGVVLPPTTGNQKEAILGAIEQLEAGGSTAGGAGIQMAYQLAQEHFIESGNNRVILATDGDFNVGISSEAELVRLIEEKRNNDIFLTVLGFGTGNLQDAKMEQLANKGNGNYAYIDNILEAKKVLVNELGGTLLTIAKDVKMQVEFNPAKVQAYRLIGYENRQLRDEDFNDDTKDAGELGAGHSVTALYEIIPAGVEADVELPEVDELRYQQTTPDRSAATDDELMWVKLRYKSPTGDVSELIEQPLVDGGIRLDATSENFRFAAAVAALGMMLRESEYQGIATPELVLRLANGAMGDDGEGYRSEFVRLVESYSLMASNR